MLRRLLQHRQRNNYCHVLTSAHSIPTPLSSSTCRPYASSSSSAAAASPPPPPQGRKQSRRQEYMKHVQKKYQHSTDETLLRGYVPVIGLEIHAQIKSNSKLFSSASTALAALPNTQVSLVDAAVPGTLPVLNEECVKKAIVTGLALEGSVQMESRFDRKHYFYADMPQGYQITQQFMPIVRGGRLTIDLPNGECKVVQIERIQIEQDSGKSLHDEHPDMTLIDLNRAGMALMEIISGPDLRSSLEAEEYIKKLQFLLKYIDVCDADMSEGQMRVDVNVSVHKPGEPFGTRCEIKNVNSLNSIARAIDFEIMRQIELLENGGTVEQQTRSFDVQTGQTILMRSKEDAPDYRFMPDPDLPPLLLSPQLVDDTQKSLPELPDHVIERLMNDHHLSKYDASVLLVSDAVQYFEQALVSSASYSPMSKRIANWITTELFGLLNQEGITLDQCMIAPEKFAELVHAVENEEISNRNAKILLEMLFEGEQRSVREIIEERGWGQINDVQLLSQMCDQVLEENPAEVEKIKQGNDRVAKFLIGQLMKKTNAKANPRVVSELIHQRIQDIKRE